MTAIHFRTGWGEARFVTASHGMTRRERLERLHQLAVASEFGALPCTPERRIRARRADRIAEALREAATNKQTPMDAQFPTLICVCGQPARIKTGLCDCCQESYDAALNSDRGYWMGEYL